MAATGNKNADKIIKVLRTLTKNDLGTVTNDTENIGLNREITKNTYIQHIIDDLIMEHKKKKICYIIRRINHLNLGQKIGLK